MFQKASPAAAAPPPAAGASLSADPDLAGDAASLGVAPAVSLGGGKPPAKKPGFAKKFGFSKGGAHGGLSRGGGVKSFSGGGR